MKRNNLLTWGCLLVVVGLALILVQTGLIPWNDDWWLPSIFLALSIFFHLLFFTGGRRAVGLLVPGGIFLVYSALLYALAFLQDDWTARLAGVWVLGPAVGITEMLLASRGREGSWVAVTVLTAVSVVMLITANAQLNFGTVAGVVLIICGLGMLVRQFIRPSAPKAEPVQEESETQHE